MATGITDQGDTVRQARYVVRKADGVGGKPIPEDEPCLVIRGQDMLAVRMMRVYIDFYTLLEDYEDAVVDELNEHLDDLLSWQSAHGVKTADR